MPKRVDDVLKTALQVVAILLLAAICLTILHKGFVDVRALSREHGGDGFFPALLRYVFRNLAGG